MSEKNDKSIQDLAGLQENAVNKISAEEVVKLKDEELQQVSGGYRGDHLA